jgi:hypothetical protein
LDEGDGRAPDQKAFIETFDPGVQMYALGDHACFLSTALDAFIVYDNILPFAESRLFFVPDITSSAAAEKKFGSFWSFVNQPALPAAAE